jgi:cell division protein FtsB
MIERTNTWRALPRRGWTSCALAVAGAGALTAPARAQTPVPASAPAAAPSAPPTVDEAKLLFGKWIETQQIVARERKDWQLQKDVLANRLEVVDKEVAVHEQKLADSKGAVAKLAKDREELQAQNTSLAAVTTQLATEVAALEQDVRRLHKQAPPHVQEKTAPLVQRIPADAATTKITVAERFQNVLGVLNELNKANQEIAVTFEVRDLGSGRKAEVRVLYLGLAQAWYVSSGGEAGVGVPGPDGWVWTPDPSIGNRVRHALEIRAGSEKPSFVPLPVRIR